MAGRALSKTLEEPTPEIIQARAQMSQVMAESYSALSAKADEDLLSLGSARIPLVDSDDEEDKDGDKKSGDVFSSASEDSMEADELLRRDVEQEFSFSGLLDRAAELEAQGRHRTAAYYCLYCINKYKDSDELDVDLLARSLDTMARLCEKNGRFEQALQFRNAEHMIYEERLGQVMSLSETAKRAKQAANEAVSGARLGTVPLKSAGASVTNSANQLERLMADDKEEQVERKLKKLEQGPDAESAHYIRKARLQAQKYEDYGRLFFDQGNMAMAKSYAEKAIDLRGKTDQLLAMVDDRTTITQDAAMNGRTDYEEALRRWKAETRGDLDAATSADEHKAHHDANAAAKVAGSSQAFLRSDEKTRSSMAESKYPPGGVVSSSETGLRQRVSSGGPVKDNADAVAERIAALKMKRLQREHSSAATQSKAAPDRMQQFLVILLCGLLAAALIMSKPYWGLIARTVSKMLR